MHADASAPSLSVLEADFRTDQHFGTADVPDATSSIQDRIITELLEFHQTNGRWPREIKDNKQNEAAQAKDIRDRGKS